MPVTLLVIAVYALAVTRVTGIITQDTITEPLRDRLIVWLDNRPATLGSSLAALITCSWCAGMWVSLIAAPLVWWHGENPWLLIPALALAFAQIIGMTSDVGR
jgi:fatty acid desaturase